jgi:hypothetical protein
LRLFQSRDRAEKLLFPIIRSDCERRTSTGWREPNGANRERANAGINRPPCDQGICRKDEAAMLAMRESVLLVSVMSGLASVTHAAPEHPNRSLTVSAAPHQVSIGYGSPGAAWGRKEPTHVAAAYFGANPATFGAYTYTASVQLVGSGSKRGLKGELRFPAFSSIPAVSVQIIASAAATPMQVTAVKVSEISERRDMTETQIIVETETIFDVPANGLFYANVVVTGVPLSPPASPLGPNSPHF